MSSSWGNKLESKLSALGEASSTESLQALAKWIGFNRKHAPVFAVKLKEAVEKASTGRQNVYLSVIHDVLKQEQGGTKWDRLADLRVCLGEEVIVPILEGGIAAGWPEKIPVMLKEWDNLNVFGVPTLIIQIRKLLSASKTSPKAAPSDKPVAVPPAAAKPVPTEVPDEPKKPAHLETLQVETEAAADVEKPSATDASKSVAEEKQPVDLEIEDRKKYSSTALSPKQAILQEVTYDFETQGIPAKHVKPSDLVEPCRSVATLQIARDLRNDGAVQLSSLLSALPEEVRAECAEAAEAQDAYGELDEEKARDFSVKTSEVLMDMDLEEQLQNVRNFRNIVERQRTARKELIHLLIQSRCNFGADDTAVAFYQADRAKAELMKRKQVLVDAMDLEGLDVEEDKSLANEAAADEELAPLTWFTEEDAMAAKRQRTE